MPDTETAAPDIGHNSAAVGEILAEKPAMLYQEPDMLKQLASEIEADIDGASIDLETEKGRKAIASRAYAIARMKSTLDEAGKALTEEHRKAVNEVNGLRSTVRETLDALRDKARDPLNEWEAAEAKREDQVNEWLVNLEATLPISIQAIKAEMELLKDVKFSSEVFRERTDEARKALVARRERLESLLAQAEKDEADRQELERRRAEDAERERQAEAKRQKEAEEERIRQAEERARKEAADQAKREAEEEQRKKDAAAQAEIDTLNRAKEKAERELRERREAEKREQEAEAQRQQDKAHRESVQAEVSEAIQAAGMISVAAARDIMLAIQAGEIPNVTLKF